MPSSIAPIQPMPSSMVQWWVQLVDSSPLENHDELRTACRWFTGAEHCRYIWDKGNPIPTAIASQGCSTPPDVQAFLGSIQHLIGRNEYMVFIMTLAADVLDQNALYHIIVTKSALARVETGKKLLAEAKGIVLDADEEIAAGS